jgi:uncharacterized protein
VPRTRAGDEVAVSDVPERSRYEGRVGGELAAYVEYRDEDGQVALVHTITEPAWQGRGIASALAAGVLELVRASGRGLVPYCPFIADYLHRHPDQADLVDEPHRHLIRPRS